MITFDEVLKQWTKENKVHTMEGTYGVRKLEKLCNNMGYKEGNFLGDEVSIANFLSDNPGAIEAILEWMIDHEVDEWTEQLNDHLNEPVEEVEEVETDKYL